MIGGALLIVGLLITGIFYVRQLDQEASVTQYQSNGAIYVQKAQTLTKTFTTILAVQYPKYEKSIFAKLGPGAEKQISTSQVNAYMVAYPQLHTSDDLVKLVDKINSLQNNIYAQQLAVVAAHKTIRVRQRNPWLITWLLP